MVCEPADNEENRPVWDSADKDSAGRLSSCSNVEFEAVSDAWLSSDSAISTKVRTEYFDDS
jgi:hypothetical protein